MTCPSWPACYCLQVGSVHTVAPEVLARMYGKEADIFSCGVVMFIILSGGLPYSSNDDAALYR